MHPTKSNNHTLIIHTSTCAHAFKVFTLMQKHAHAHTHKDRIFLHSFRLLILSVILLLTTKARGVSLESRVKVRGQTCTQTLHYTIKSTWSIRMMKSTLINTHTLFLHFIHLHTTRGSNLPAEQAEIP